MTELIRVLGTSGREGKGEGQFAQPRGICINHLTKELTGNYVTMKNELSHSHQQNKTVNHY
jgi:hypothetical protein